MLMNLTITALHLKNPTKAKEYAKEKIEKLYKFHSKIEKIEVRLVDEKNHGKPGTSFMCEITIMIPGHNLEIKDFESSIEAAIDKAEDRAKRILVKSKEKHLTRDHKSGIMSKLREKLPF